RLQLLDAASPKSVAGVEHVPGGALYELQVEGIVVDEQYDRVGTLDLFAVELDQSDPRVDLLGQHVWIDGPDRRSQRKQAIGDRDRSRFASVAGVLLVGEAE